VCFPVWDPAVNELIIVDDILEFFGIVHSYVIV